MYNLVYPTELSNINTQQVGDDPNFFMAFQAKYILNEDLVETFKKIGLNVDLKASARLQKISPIVILPIPENIEEELSHNWNLTKGLGSQLLSSAANSVLGMAGSTLSNVAASVSSTAQISIDPNFKYVYQGSNPRTFTYSLTLVPRNKDEADTIAAIIKYFKVYSSPIPISGNKGFVPSGSLIGKGIKSAQDALNKVGVDLKAGAISNFTWQIKFQSQKLNQMTKFDKRDFALLSVHVNYTGSGSSMFYKDGSPKQVNLTLTFAEMKVMYSSDWS